MQMKSVHLIGLIALAAAKLQGQTYWSVTPPDCSSLSNTQPTTITNSSGATIGYSCTVTGTFVWLAAGGTSNTTTWGTVIRSSAPASAPIGVDYLFYDQSGNNLSV